VKAQPGFVLADPPDVVVLADRPVMFEPLIYSFLMAEGRWQADPAVRMICDGEVSLVVLDYPLDAQDNTAFGAFHAWPDPVFTALEDAMQPSGQLDNRDLYTPRSHPGGVCSST
jgi:hypothetical protein